MMFTTAANTYIEVSPLTVTHALHMGPSPEGDRCALYLSNREHPIYLKENAAKVMRAVEQEQARLLWPQEKLAPEEVERIRAEYKDRYSMTRGAMEWPEPPKPRTIGKGL